MPSPILPIRPVSSEPNPAVTVVIPTRDRWSVLPRALSAALGQEGVDLEVVVVDDGSSQPPPAELAAAAGGRVRLERLPVNRGVSAARNAGVAVARGAWIAFLDDDDLWAPDRLRRMLAVAAESGADVVVCGSVALEEDGTVLRVDVEPDLAGLPAALRVRDVMGVPSEVIVRREALDRVGGFAEGFAVCADWELWLRLVDAGARVVACRGPLTGYVVHPDGMHVRRTEQALREFDALVARYGRATAPGDPGMHDRDFVRWVARSLRHGGQRRRAAALYLRNAVRHRGAGDVVRAAGALLGERAVRRVQPLPPAMAAPAWLGRYRPADGAAGLVPLRPPAAA